jgi:hypothetical protein
MSEALAYLGMCRSVFNETVRPYVREVPIGKQGIAFDRVELDQWADAYLAAHSIDKKSIPIDDMRRSERRHSDTGAKKLWHAKQSAASRYEAMSGTSTRLSKGNEFTKALELVRGKKQNATSSTG